MSHWASGEPEHLADAFFNTTEEGCKSLGALCYLRFVAAISAASVHNALAHAIGVDETARQQVSNILLTAKSVERLAAAKVPQDDDDSGGSSEDEDGRNRVPGITLENTSPLAQLTAVVHCIMLNGADDVTPPQQFEAASVAAPWGTSLMSLPNGILQAIVSLLDGRSAAGAAAACRQLNLVHRLNRFFELSAPFRCYLAALVHLQDDFSDGSVESEFCVHFPLDGSAVCGQDLAAEAYNHRMRAILPDMAQIFALLGVPGGRSIEDFKSSIPGTEQQPKRPPSQPLSTPLAFVKAAKAVPMLIGNTVANPRAPTASAIRAPCGAEKPATATTATSGTAVTAATASASAASATAAPLVSSCCLSNAMCDVQEVRGVPSGRLHCDGDLASVAYARGWKLRDAGLYALVLGSGADSLQLGNHSRYDSHGFFSRVTRVCSDITNGLVWAAVDDGRRIKAFRAPVPAATPLAGCNRGEPNGMSLQYTLCSEVGGLDSRHAGLHVIGTRVVSVKGSGALLVWDIADISPQAAASTATRIRGRTDDDYDDSNDTDMDTEDGGGGDSARSEAFTGSIGSLDSGDPDPVDLDVTRGVHPQGMTVLPLPSSRGAPSASSLLAALAGEYRRDVIQSTCLLLDEATSVAPTLVAALGGNIVLTYDLETQRVKQRLFGHLYDITEIAAPPPAWRQPSVFATSSRSGDVKVWDVRMRGGAAAVTLTTGATDPLNTVVLATASSGSGDQARGNIGGSGGGTIGIGSGSGGQLGAGMVCFAGGEGESIWAWDLRAGHARPLYELSTGNTAVQSLVWHQAGNSLVAACESSWEDRMGSFNRRDWKRVRMENADGSSNGGGSDDTGGGSNGGWSGSSRGSNDTEGDSAGFRHGRDSSSGDGGSDGPAAAGDDDDGAQQPALPARAQLQPGGGGDVSRRRRLLWPARARHQPGDFGVYFNMARSCVLRYRFSEQAKRDVPRSVAPSLALFD